MIILNVRTPTGFVKVNLRESSNILEIAAKIITVGRLPLEMKNDMIYYLSRKLAEANIKNHTFNNMSPNLQIH